MLNTAYKTDGIPDSMSKLLGINLHCDIFNRIYGVVHPISQQITNGQSAIFALTPNGSFDAEPSIRVWLFDRLTAMSKFLSAQNLLDCLTLDLRKIDDDNWLLVMTPVFFGQMKKSAIFAGIELLIIAVSYIIFYFI